MAFYKKSGKGKSPGIYPWAKQDMVNIAWCMKKGIKIAVQPKNGDEWEIEITIGKSVNLDPKSYSDKEALKQMYKYYKYYYDKHNKQ
tara:strand:- start:1183 stop:1443 length:261 start_codon:yes stop_codon:yes gene_type:complete